MIKLDPRSTAGWQDKPRVDDPCPTFMCPGTVRLDDIDYASIKEPIPLAKLMCDHCGVTWGVVR